MKTIFTSFCDRLFALQRSTTLSGELCHITVQPETLSYDLSKLLVGHWNISLRCAIKRINQKL